MPNARDMTVSATKRILFVGETGAGKSAQMWTLPGRKFLYLFDPNTKATIGKHKQRSGLDIEYEEFLPEPSEMDGTLKSFNKDSSGNKFKSDRPKGPPREPQLYNRWVDDVNERGSSGFFAQFDWLCVDSLTFLTNSCMARELFINGRYGGLEELADYRIVGSKISHVFTSLSSTDTNIYMTAHINKFQDEKTKKIETLINAPGSARSMLPLVFTDIWQAERSENARGEPIYTARTMPDVRGLKSIRCSIPNVPEIVDVTIPDFPSNKGGIGALLAKYNS